jgi:cardiolipin synthase (CMP-forming)
VPESSRRIFTIPNVISVVRLLCVPVFLWLVWDDREAAAAVLLAVLGATDWVDGWIARRFDQTSTLGMVLDPTADRLLLLTAAIALTVDGVVPVGVGIAVLTREVVVSIAALGLALAGAARVDVRWVGKAGTFGTMFALPAFLLADIVDRGAPHDLVELSAWLCAAGGLGFGYLSLVRYLPAARTALRAGRVARHLQSLGTTTTGATA